MPKPKPEVQFKKLEDGMSKLGHQDQLKWLQQFFLKMGNEDCAITKKFAPVFAEALHQFRLELERESQ
jgi:hypothetical protein